MAEAKTRVCGFSAIVVLPVLAITGTELLAEPADKKTPEAVPDQTYIANEPIETCMERWDAATHMTKDQWRATCMRMKKEREPVIKTR
jgi:hypothetical protein